MYRIRDSVSRRDGSEYECRNEDCPMYYALRYKGAPKEVRIERAETPAFAFKRAFGRGNPSDDAEWKRIPGSVYRSDAKRAEAINDPAGWITFPKVREEVLPPPSNFGKGMTRY